MFSSPTLSSLSSLSRPARLSISLASQKSTDQKLAWNFQVDVESFLKGTAHVVGSMQLETWEIGLWGCCFRLIEEKASKTGG